MPVRMCVGCQEMKNKKEMIRVIKTPEGTFMLDATGKKNGRGAYVCPSEECLQLARKNKGLERSFKQAIPAEVYESLEKEMECSALRQEREESSAENLPSRRK